MRLRCPYCHNVTKTPQTRKINDNTRELYHVCLNQKCGCIFKSIQSIGQIITPPQNQSLKDCKDTQHA